MAFSGLQREERDDQETWQVAAHEGESCKMPRRCVVAELILVVRGRRQA